jgi:hypothetical protein
MQAAKRQASGPAPGGKSTAQSTRTAGRTCPCVSLGRHLVLILVFIIAVRTRAARGGALVGRRLLRSKHGDARNGQRTMASQAGQDRCAGAVLRVRACCSANGRASARAPLGGAPLAAAVGAAGRATACDTTRRANQRCTCAGLKPVSAARSETTSSAGTAVCGPAWAAPQKQTRTAFRHSGPTRCAPTQPRATFRRTCCQNASSTASLSAGTADGSLAPCERKATLLSQPPQPTGGGTRARHHARART